MYRVYISSATYQALMPTNVIVEDSHAIQYEPVGAGLRPAISQPFILTSGNGYEFVMNGGSEEENRLRIVEVDYDGNDQYVLFDGVFSWGDCRFDRFRKIIRAKLQRNDTSRRMVGNINTEYDFLKLGAERVTVNYKKFPVLQLYLLEGSQIVNIQLGNSWTREVEPIRGTVGGNSLVSDLSFSPPQKLAYVPFVEGNTEDVSGIYSEDGTTNPGVTAYRRQDGAYRIFYDYYGPVVTDPDDDTPEEAQWKVRRLSDNQIIYETPIEILLGGFPPRFPGRQIPLLISVDNPDEKIEFQAVTAYSRVLTNSSSFGGITTSVISSTDNLATGMNYTRVAPYQLSAPVPSVVTTSMDEGLGRYAYSSLGPHGGQYVKKIDGLPLVPQAWSFVAWFYQMSPSTRTAILDAAETLTVPDAYTFRSVLDVVVRESSAGQVAHPATASNLLYGQMDPYTNAPPLHLLIVPKSNITYSGYTEAASRGPMRLQDLLELTKVIRNANYLEKDGVINIEHQQYYDQGGSYLEDQVGYDLTLDREVQTGSSWERDQQEYAYDPGRIPERIKFRQADKVSDTFAGQPIELLSRYAQGNGEKELRTGPFTFDLDFVLAQTDSVSENGYMLLACTYDETTNIYSVAFEGDVQNGSLTFPFIQEKYYRNALPSKRAIMNGQEIGAGTVLRTVEQPISVPMTPQQDLGKLIKTSIGNGRVASASFRLNSREMALNLEHEPG